MPVSILMPALSPTMTEGNVSKWLKKVGDNINSGDIIAEVETDKATMEVEAIDEGKLAKIIYDDGAENISVNSLIGVISLEGESDKDVDLFVKENSSQSIKGIKKNDNNIDIAKDDNNIDIKKNDKEKVLEEEIIETKTVIHETDDDTLDIDIKTNNFSISPLAKRIAGLKNIDISQIVGSGPRGRIIKRDLDSIIKDNTSDLITGNENNIIQNQSYIKLPLSNIRKTIASKLQKSKQTVPHFYLKCKACVDEFIKLRSTLNSLDINDDSFKISYNDIIIKAVASALKLVPEMNSTWNQDSILRYNLADISVAVATKEGLFTPVVKSACKKTISEISKEMVLFIDKAKNNKLMPDEYNGGSFSISNLGMYNVNEFSAIINPPQSGILAVGEIFSELKLSEDKVITANMINLVLSVDHRVADGATAAVFLDKIKFFIEKPMGMLV